MINHLDCDVEGLINRRYQARTFVASLEESLFPPGGLTRNQIIELMRLYNPDDPIDPRPDITISTEWLYFYYLRVNTAGVISCYQFFYDHKSDINYTTALRKIDDFIDAPAAGQKVDIEALRWEKPCVIAFALEPSYWSFFKSQRRGTIQFPDAAVYGSPIYYRNRTFYRNEVLPSPKGREVMLVKNFHMLPDGATPRSVGGPYPPDDYKFDLYLNAKVEKPLQDGTTITDLVTVTIDPGGKNLGP